MLRTMDEVLPLPYFDNNDIVGDDVDDEITRPAPVRRSPGPPGGRQWVLVVVSALLLLAILLGALAFVAVQQRRAQSPLESTQVTRGNFALSVSAVGPVQSGVYNVDFTGTGKIAEIDVHVGESVVKGQVLAKLDKTSLQDAVNSAQAAVQSAQTALNNAQNTYGKTAAQAQAALAAAQTELKNAQVNQTNTQAQTQTAVDAAQTSLTDAQNSLREIEAESQASIASAQTALTDAQNSLTATQALAKEQIAVAYDQEQLAIQQCNASPTPGPTLTPTPTPTANCIALAKDKYNQAVAAANASVSNAQNQVNSARQQLASAQVQAAANGAQAQEQISAAQNQLNTAQAQATSENAQAQGQVSAAQKQLKTALANAASSQTTAQGQISAAQAQLNSAQVQLQTARHNLENDTLFSPHAGIIMSVNGTVGGAPGTPVNSSTTGGGTVTFIQIVDVSSLQVLAYVNEADTAYLKVGESASLTVAAYTGRTFHGTVSALSLNGQTVSGVVTYPVYIDVDMSGLRGAHLLPGMTASVTINVVQRNNVVLIPVGAVNFARAAPAAANGAKPLITQAQASAALDEARQMLRSLETQQPEVANDNPIPAFVIEQANAKGQFVARPVVLGLTNDTVYEVLAGLSPGESIIVGAQTQG